MNRIRSDLNLRKIVSGGQTGVDRAALEVAIFLDLPYGGWCPKGRRAEDGMIPDRFQLLETESKDYSVRTEKNVLESDGTLILYWNSISGGTLLTANLCRKHCQPLLKIDLAEFGWANGGKSGTKRIDWDSDQQKERLVNRFSDWIEKNKVQELNVAGPRESSCNGIQVMTESFLLELLVK